jgi:hypothetical protein
LAKATLNNPQMLHEFNKTERQTAIKVLKESGLYNDKINAVYQGILKNEKERERNYVSPIRVSTSPKKPEPSGPRPDRRLVRDPYGGVHTVDQVRGNRCVPGKDQSRER